MDYWEIFVYIGTLRILYLILQAIYFNYYLKIDINTYKYGWIVITGASDGIGKAISEELARRGFKLILISRSEEKLINLVETLKSIHKTEDFHYIPCDFKHSHRNPEEFYGKLMKKLEKFEISGLINNVGVLEFKSLSGQSLESIENQLGVNMYPQTLLSYHVLPEFIKRFDESKKRSLLVNIASLVDLMNMPNTTVYSAAKRYAEFLSEGIRLEYSNKVDVVTVKPGAVITNMTNSVKGNHDYSLPLAVEASCYAQYLINHLHQGVNYGHWKHSLIAFCFDLTPHHISNFVIKIFIRIIQNLGLVKN
jgi:17beta-estradiol 17-dehydrogenase / very-long-chain 3-oxoacyl-CoA reductase